LKVANRELGTISQIDSKGHIAIQSDSGKLVEFDINQHPHLDYGYAMTSHSSQGQTTDRVLIHADTEKGELLINTRMAYVAVSRARYDAQIYTDNKEELAEHLSREHSHTTAIETGHEHHHEHNQATEQEVGSASVNVESEQGHQSDQGHEHCYGAAHETEPYAVSQEYQAQESQEYDEEGYVHNQVPGEDQGQAIGE
jgi:hypothetical protein